MNRLVVALVAIIVVLAAVLIFMWGRMGADRSEPAALSAARQTSQPDAQAAPAANAAEAAPANSAERVPIEWDGETIPAQFRGRWAKSKGRCSGIETVEVGSKGIDYYESRGLVDHMTVAEGGIEARIKFEGEGETWTQFTRFARQGPKLVMTERGETADKWNRSEWVSCP